MALGLTDVTALCGAVLGGAGFALGIANYLRDRPRLRVTLQFDMEGFGHASRPRPWLVTSIANTGRRPIFVSHVGLRPASRWKHRHTRATLFVWGSQEGRRLQEGDAPWIVPSVQDPDVVSFAKRFRALRAFVVDSAGRIYYSPAASLAAALHPEADAKKLPRASLANAPQISTESPSRDG